MTRAKAIVIAVLTFLIFCLLSAALTACTPQPADNTPTPPARLPMVQRMATAEPTEAAPPADNTAVCIVTAQALNVRSGPGAQFPIVGALYGGDVLTVTQIIGSWGQLSAGGYINLGWCK